MQPEMVQTARATKICNKIFQNQSKGAIEANKAMNKFTSKINTHGRRHFDLIHQIGLGCIKTIPCLLLGMLYLYSLFYMRYGRYNIYVSFIYNIYR